MTENRKQLVAELEKLPALYANEEAGDSAMAPVKVFTPDAGATWWLSEYDPREMLAFGLCDLGLGFPELGYVSIAELLELRGPLGLEVELDEYYTPKDLGTLLIEAHSED